MKRPTFLGSAFTVLLLFSVISYSRTLVQQQDPKAVQPTQSVSNQQEGVQAIANQPAASAKLDLKSLAPASSEGEVAASSPGPKANGKIAVAAAETIAVVSQTYTATAYTLRGRTASGRPVSRGLIAADPSILPLGSRVRVEARSLSGEYLVADTGGAVRGRHIDIWTPTAREAMQFGRRAVKLTVLSFGARRQRNRARPGKDPFNAGPLK